MADVVTVQLRFGIATSLGLYQDTLSFTEDEWAKRDDAAIAKAKQALADTWVMFRSAQIADEQALETEQGKLDKIAHIDAQIADLTATKEVFSATLSVVSVSPMSVG